MGKLGITTSDKEAKEWKEEAEELDITQSRYGRERIRAGRRLWSSGEFQADTLTQLLDSLEDQTEKNGNSGRNEDFPQATIGDNLADIVHRELPVDDVGDPVDLSELLELIFGTEEEQRSAVLNALEILESENRAERKITGGFVKIKNEQE